MQLDNFIYNPKGMSEEYEAIKKAQERIVRLNGNNENAIALAYKTLENEEKMLSEYIKSRMIKIALTEKALAEISDNIK